MIECKQHMVIGSDHIGQLDLDLIIELWLLVMMIDDRRHKFDVFVVLGFAVDILEAQALVVESDDEVVMM